MKLQLISIFALRLPPLKNETKNWSKHDFFFVVVNVAQNGTP